MVISTLYMYKCVYNLKDIGINKENKIFPPSSGSISGYRCERTNMARKCEMFMN